MEEMKSRGRSCSKHSKVAQIIAMGMITQAQFVQCTLAALTWLPRPPGGSIWREEGRKAGAAAARPTKHGLWMKLNSDKGSPYTHHMHTHSNWSSIRHKLCCFSGQPLPIASLSSKQEAPTQARVEQAGQHAVQGTGHQFYGDKGVPLPATLRDYVPRHPQSVHTHRPAPKGLCRDGGHAQRPP